MSIDDDRIEKLKRKLYSRTIEPARDVRSDIHPKDISLENSWGKDDSLIIPEDMTQNKAHPFLKKFLLVAGIFFVVSLGVSAYVFFSGGNSISSNNINIQVAGPSVVASGEEVDLNVSLINQNHADLNLAQWSVDYPTGTFADQDSSTVLSHTSETIGTIGSGQSINRTIKLFLFGDKNVTKTIVFKLVYEVSGSNAIFTKEKDYDLTIGSSPVILNVTAPTQITSGQEVTLHSTVTSNSSSLLHNVMVSVQYPYGFTFENSAPTSVSGNNALWNLGDLKSGDTKNLSITGKLVAQNGEQRTFQFSVGTQSTDPGKDIGTVLGSANPTVTVSKPALNTILSLSGDTSESVATGAHQTISSALSFTNTLPESLSNVSVQVHIAGSGLDASSVNVANGGFYQSGNNTISWDKNSTPILTSLDPSSTANLGFSFSTNMPGISVKNPEVSLDATISGTHVSSNGTTETISSTVSKTVKISANLSLISKTLHGGAFNNTGPATPKAGTPSTYTIDWSLSNTWNDVNGTEVTTTLPPYVDWTGNVMPATTNITYDANSRTITWNPDSVSAGAGYSLSPKAVQFQLKLNPSISQVGTVPQLTSQIAVIANDNFSGQTISFGSGALTTQTADTNNNGIVTK